jgi:galactokinase
VSQHTFEDLFGRPPDARAEAPGRVNLIGEHTDYNGGFVLPTPIPLLARVEIASRPGREARAASANVDDGCVESFTIGEERPRGDWLDYIQGVSRVLQNDGFEIRGFDLRLDSDLPVGGGLSSSAAMAVAFQRALRTLFGLPLDDLQLARAAQRAENEFVGARVGVMDPLASSLGRPGFALFLDTRDLSRRHVPIPESIELVVVDSGTGHRHADGGYNQRRQECERAAGLLGVRRLRDLEPRDHDRIAALPPPLDRRVRHVVSENARVLASVEALEKDEPAQLGELLDASHRSLRDDFEVSTDAIEVLVRRLRAEVGVFGARLTGGGFGGAVMAIAERGRGLEAARRAAESYRAETGNDAPVLLPPAASEVSVQPGAIREA